MKRLVAIAAGSIVAVSIAARFLQVDFVRPKIERALERGLGRRVEIGETHFDLLTGPGFALSRVTIHEDPRAGIEPFAYMDSLQARVRLLSLFKGRLEFSSLALGDASVNLVKTDAGPWNFQFLLGGASARSGVPAIKMRGGRVNFKFGETKSVFYFNDADFDVSPSSDGSVDLRFSGAPSRTDRSAQNFGNFFIRGTWKNQRLDMKVELERSALEEVARLVDRRGLDVHGLVAFNAQLFGPPSRLEITGQLQVDDIHRWDLLPQRSSWRIGYKGTLNLPGERLELASASDLPNPPLALQFRASDFLSNPHWDAAMGLTQIPISTLVEIARHMGVVFPEKLVTAGSVSGSVRYGDPDGLAGGLELLNASLTLPDAQPLHAASMAVAIDRRGILLQRSTVNVGDDESADIEGSYALAPGGLELKISTRGLHVADLRSFRLASIPLLDQTAQGAWRGSTHYRWSPGAVGEWSGDYELQNARIAVDGLSEPLRIQSAAVSFEGKRVAVSRLRAKAGTIEFTGQYRWEPGAARPHKFHIAIPEVDAAALEHIFSPTLVRQRGFLARTLRLGSAPLPDWLKARRAEGTLSVDSLTMGDSHARIDTARLLWDGAMVRLVRVNAEIDQAALHGELDVDLAGRSPHYHAEGELRDVAYDGGKLDFEGAVDADGSGAQLLTGMRGKGTMHGRSIAFAPGADFRTVDGYFEVQSGADGPRWKFTELEVLQGGDLYYGTGATQADGKLVLDLENQARQVRLIGALLTPVP